LTIFRFHTQILIAHFNRVTFEILLLAGPSSKPIIAAVQGFASFEFIQTCDIVIAAEETKNFLF
jgi:enoyl-CoA hydratase/carnithine racemase